jgi:glycosyltransferase involved in cell wall biosynthesis
MKFAIDCRMLGMSGIGTYLENVLDELVINHHEHNYLLIGQNKTLQKYKGKDHVYILESVIKPFSLKELFCFPTKEINKCDVFFSPYINLPLGIKCPICSTIHDVIFLDIPNLTGKLGNIIRKGYYKRTLAVSKVVFTVSEFSKDRIQHHFGNKKNIRVIYNSVSKEIKAFDEHLEKEKNIIFVGNIKEHKGLKILIKAFSEAREEGLDYNLVIVGENKYRTSDAEIFNLLLQRKDIVFTGRLSDKELHDEIAKATVLVLPSLYEGFGIPPMEAMYLGTNAIISDISVFQEIYDGFPVTFFRSGDVEDLKDKLLHIDDIPPLNRKEAIEKLEKKYNIIKIVENVLSAMIVA